MAELFTCAICGKIVPTHCSYIVRIEVLADPSVPAVNEQTLADASEELEHLLEEIEGMTEDELEDQVYRSFEFRICGKCQPMYLANPMARPRAGRPAHN